MSAASVVVKSASIGSGKEATRGYNPSEAYALTLALEEASATAELEPNDEPLKATPFQTDGERRGFYAPKSDTDYFQLTSSEPRLLRVELEGVDRVDAELSLVALDSEGGKEQPLLRANDGGLKEGELLINLAVSPETPLLLKVQPAARQVEGKWVRDQENPEEPYRLVVTSRPDQGGDEREPNNESGAATPIELGKTARGHIHPKKDVDVFEVNLTSSPVKVPLRATVTGILKVDVALELYSIQDGKRVLLQRSEKNKGEQPETIRFTVDPGLYFLEVADTSGWNSNFLDAYQLLVERDE